MKKIRFTAVTAVMLGAFLHQAVCSNAQNYESEGFYGDSVKVTQLNEVEIYATRASSNTPIAHSELSREEIARLNTGQDFPFMLTLTPSVVATSDAGNGIGYTGIRIRGVDASRINVTSNGVPMNDAESHVHFWVNIPDFASSVQDIQIQRGVGTSTNGSGAFGGSININTESTGTEPFAETGLAVGSYGTHRQTIKLGTGLIGGRWAFNARLSNVTSDGYLDRAFVRQKSFFVQGAYYGRKTVVKLIAFGGQEQTYHAWDGITFDQLEAYGRRYNPSGIMERVARDANGVPLRDEYGNVITEQTGFYNNQTDNYKQFHYQLIVNRQLNARWKLNATLHYTDGSGYYEEYKNFQKFIEYGLVPYMPADPSKEAWLDDNGMVDRSNLIRRKKMDNGFGGMVAAASYTGEDIILTLGGAANHYGGEHFGNVIWIENYSGNLSPNHEYYRNETSKTDANIYAKADYRIAKGLHLYADAQYRYISHKINGTGDIWDNRDANTGMQILDINKSYSFFNPKGGMLWNIGNGNTVYGSVAVAHKEPTRNNHVEATSDNPPKPERLTDYELGYTYRSRTFTAGANLYYMYYRDQFVLTGRLNDIGEPVSDNVHSSYRAGMELQAGVQITDCLRWDGNATFSRNIINDYVQYGDVYDGNYDLLPGQERIELGKTNISFSPSVIAGSVFTFDKWGFNAMLHTQYVGRQYVTNTGDSTLRLDDYCVTNLRLNYTFGIGKIKSISAGISLNNLFGARYSSNGWGAEWFVKDEASGELTKETLLGFYPQATFNILAGITVRF